MKITIALISAILVFFSTITNIEILGQTNDTSMSNGTEIMNFTADPTVFARHYWLVVCDENTVSNCWFYKAVLDPDVERIHAPGDYDDRQKDFYTFVCRPGPTEGPTEGCRNAGFVD